MKKIKQNERLALRINYLGAFIKYKRRNNMCEHKWKFQNSVYSFEYGRSPSGQDNYKRIDTYYCEKCLTTKEVTAKDEWCRKKPYWWKNN